MTDALQHGREWITVLCVGGGRERPEGAAMVGAMRGDDAGAAGGDPRILQRRLDRLRAGISERDPGQLRRQERTKRLQELFAGRRLKTLVSV